MTDTKTSAEAVERLAQDCDNFERMSDHESTLAHLHNDCGNTLRALLAERDQLQAQVEKAAVGLRESIKQLRVIAGMDLMGASSIAYNAAREAEATLDQIAAYRKARGEG